MALGTLGTALAGSALTAGANIGLSRLLNPKSGSSQAPLTNFRLPGFTGGGLSAVAGNDGSYSVAASPERFGLVGNVAGLFGKQADEFGALRPSVAPGVSDLRAARLSEIEDARTRAVGNLRENLQRRRVLGSSFGQDTLARAENEFGQAKERVAAESFLQELELTNQLIQQQYEAGRQQYQTSLNELNLQADVGAKLAANASTTLGTNARFLAEMNAKEAASAGKFYIENFQPVTKAAGNYFSDLLKNSGSGAPNLGGGIWAGV